MKELSVIMPALNEGTVIHNSIKAIEKALSNPGELDYEIIVVDNGSSDNTYSEAARAVEENGNIKVIKLEEKGKGLALKSGFNFVSGERVTFIDADSDLNPKQILLFIEYMRRYNADIVVGSKRHPLSRVDYPRYRKFLSRGYQIITKLLFNLNVRDTQAGLKLFNYEVLNEILPRVLCKKYAFDLELLVNAHHRGFKIVEAPIELTFNFDSRIDWKAIWDIFVDTLAIAYRMHIKNYYDRMK